MTSAPGVGEAGAEAVGGPGPVTLRVRELDRALAFYRDLLGLEVEEDGAGSWRLSASGSVETLLVLHDVPGAPPRPPRAAGLFHVALLVPSREELAGVLLRLRAAGPSAGGGSLEGASDHGVSRALYLADPEGNGLEIYHDRPREAWPSNGGRITLWTRPLDLGALLEGVDREATLPPGTTVGHVHLRTTDLDDTEAFWTGETGMEVMVRSYPGALFLAHGGYHHHLGLNVWGGPFAPAPEGAAGLARVEWWLRRGAAPAREDPAGGVGASGGPPNGGREGVGGVPRVVRAPDGVEVLLR